MRIRTEKFAIQSRHSFTAMIDVVFLLLLFFILQPFKHVDFKMEVPVGGGDLPPDHNRPMPTYLYVRGEENKVSYAVNRQLVRSAEGLAQAIRNDLPGDRPARVVIQAESGVNYRHVMTALDQCHAAGVSDVQLVDTRKDPRREE